MASKGERNAGKLNSRLFGFLYSYDRLTVFFGALGVCIISLLGFLENSRVLNIVGQIAILSVLIGTVLAAVHLRSNASSKVDFVGAVRLGPSFEWRILDKWAAGLVALTAGICVQRWFVAGTVIAGWDSVPPQGTAWTTRLFSSWVWSGSNLGGPGAGEVGLPWAGVLWFVHSLGGSAGLAQRIWYTALVMSAAAAGFYLLRLLGISILPAGVGAFIYVFNPNTMTSALSPVYLAAMVLLAGLPACVIAVSARRWTQVRGAVCIGLSAPLVGYAFSNPPLVGMIGIAVVASIFAAGLLYGKKAGINAMKVAMAGGALLIVVSAYWIVPSYVQLGAFNQASYLGVGGWAWEEIRATVSNSLWLNTTWAWTSSFYPFARSYSSLPLDLVKYSLPAVAFSALPLAYWLKSSDFRRRIVVGASGLALFIVVFATGTRWPGSVIFDPLYSLPVGWLMREPFRFLIVVGLAYGVLAGMTLQMLAELSSTSKLLGSWTGFVGKSGLVLLAAVLMVPSYPLFTGQIFAGNGTLKTSGATYSPHHVVFPSYWISMTDFLNKSSTPKGNLLVLPPDTNSDMVSYDWGYFGVDAFMFNLFDRNVIVPNSQNYFSSSSQLMETVTSMSTAIIAHEWSMASDLANAMNANLVLVRGDVAANSSDPRIVSPKVFAASLKEDPLAVLIQKEGPLELFRLDLPAAKRKGSYATVNTPNPDPRDLSILPPGTSLVTSKQRLGSTAVVEFPPYQFDEKSHDLTTSVVELKGWKYSLSWLANDVNPSPVVIGHQVQSLPAFRSQRVSKPNGALLTISVPLPNAGNNLLPDGTFSQGPWQATPTDCNNGGAQKPTAITKIIGKVQPSAGPGGAPALLLSASTDSACESQKLKWTSGPLEVSLAARSLQGAVPRICLWQYPDFGCAATPTLQGGTQWKRYLFTVQPRPGTTSLAMFLYADGGSPGTSTVDQYSTIDAFKAVPSFQPVLVGTPLPTSGSSAVLTTTGEAYSSSWVGPPQYTHVLVDGIRNGWLGATPASGIRYGPSGEEALSFLLSASAVMAILAWLIFPLFLRMMRPLLCWLKAQVRLVSRLRVWR